MSDNMRWIVLALLGALFAAVVQVSSKAALNAKVFDAATLNLMRAIVMVVAFVGVIGFEVFLGRRGMDTVFSGSLAEWPTQRAVLLALFSGLAAAASWYFGYKALQLADVSQTYPLDKLSVGIGVVLALIFFHERPSAWNWSGIVVMLVGAYLVTLPRDGNPLSGWKQFTTKSEGTPKPSQH